MSPSSFRFGEFELDVERYQLLHRGIGVKLENLPLQLLMLLVQRRGQLVSRREIEEELWGKDVFVDVEQGINTAVRKIRQVLRDHPEKPRYVQTVVGKGYRFLAADVHEAGAVTDTPVSPNRVSDATVTVEELGQAILSAAGLEKCPPKSPSLSHKARSGRRNKATGSSRSEPFLAVPTG